MKTEVSVLIRTAALAAALINQILVLAGLNTLPFTEDEITRGLTAAATAAVSLWTWWKNNSFTEAAKKGDQVMKAVKEQEK